MRSLRLRLRTLLIAVAVAGTALGGVVWTRKLRGRAAYYAFVAGAYELEARNHARGVEFYREISDERRRGVGRDMGYQDYQLFTNDYAGRLTVSRQDEWWSEHDAWPADPDPDREQARLAALQARERARAGYFAALGVKYRRAARLPWLPVPPDTPPPEQSPRRPLPLGADAGGAGVRDGAVGRH